MNRNGEVDVTRPGSRAGRDRAADRRLRRVTLEMSLKPFRSLTDEAIEAVCEEAFRQWAPLLDMADTASVLLWTADGSEILVWDGELGRELEWGRYIGFANEWTFDHITDGKRDRKTAILYTPEPARFTYRDLQRVIAALKRVGRARCGIPVEVGATFDAGPEFAYSDFKYKDHPEINRAELGGRPIGLRASYTVVCPWATLHADDVRYAAYPDGIPEGTPFGEFLGGQCASFLPALGFDYIWFSNGFGLSYFPWTYLGANYDGTNMPLADRAELSGKVLGFWDAFHAACPDTRIEVRGTNYGTGMDLAKDCIPIRELYERGYLAYPPPNSPWGALNHDFGLELTGYLSRIAALPGETYPFRYYPNDPWFWQNPWTDLYDRQPHDIYLPLSVARLDAEGQPQAPGIVELLTIDTEYGELPEDTALEVSAHVRRALRDFPDAPGLMTWVYPFDELHDAAAATPPQTGSIFFHDWFMRHAINEGLPVSGCISSVHAARLLEAGIIAGRDAGTRDSEGAEGMGGAALAETILVVATSWLRGDDAQRIADWVACGGRVLLYGPVRDAALAELLNVRQVEPLSGEGELTIDAQTDEIAGGSSREMRIDHRPLVSDGGLGELCADAADPHTRIRARVAVQGQERLFALSRSLPQWQGGAVCWLRGSLPLQDGIVTHLPVRQDAALGDSAVVARYLLQDFGYTLLQTKADAASPSAMLLAPRRAGAQRLVGSRRDTSVSFRMRFPEGVPLPTGMTALAGPGAAELALDGAFAKECRVFVDQPEPALVTCREAAPDPTRAKRTLGELPQRKLVVSGLREARLTVALPPEAASSGRVEVAHGETELDVAGCIRRGFLQLAAISGTIEIVW
ncbi:hypothetical protein IDH44_06505 [Paenibacillus sp. IB182496]|uniref:Uncharacterized protein n=1 Tax=Paenibacillus sabuli TaxID=2772509 RepID=A0A927BRB2_9BACL|nr:hypothetical protein [Paenibacillus sabuli]MBD2844837.1 hypothetical protein [Paenibacillus sabuli]